MDSGTSYAVSEGTAVITAKVNGFSNYTDSVTVTVKRSTAAVITASAGAGDPLDFSGLRGQFQNRASAVLGEPLSYISGLSVPTDQGTLYYRYTSGDDTGAGVGTAERYYVSPGSGQMGLSDLTFVPKGDFSGTAVISYTGYASGTRFFQGTVEVEVDAQKDVGYSAANGEAVQFNADDFNAVCRARTGLGPEIRDIFPAGQRHPAPDLSVPLQSVPRHSGAHFHPVLCLRHPVFGQRLLCPRRRV